MTFIHQANNDKTRSCGHCHKTIRLNAIFWKSEHGDRCLCARCHKSYAATRLTLAKADEAYYKECIRQHERIGRIGFGYGMRAYSSLKNNFTRENKLRCRVEGLKLKIRAFEGL